MRLRPALFLLALSAFAIAASFSCRASLLLTNADIAAWPAEPADAVVAYGPGPLQNAELRLPKTPGHHPVAVVLPCHRIIGSNGTLTGYGGGLPRKRWLLDHEGVTRGLF